MLDYISLIGGLTILLVAGDVLVRGSVAVAQRLGIPSLVIGLTIVAFGTSAPELVISLRAALDGAPGIAVGNVVGSNIANVLLVMGVPALLASTSCRQSGATRNAVFLTVVTIIFITMCTFDPLGRPMGIALLSLLALFLYNSVHEMRKARKHRKIAAGLAACAPEPCCDSDNELSISAVDTEGFLEEVESIPDGLPLAVFLMIVGLISLPVGGHLAIEGAVAIARQWGVTETAIGLTVIALGTSLPELATTVMAVKRNHSAVALGNVIGSNVFNLLAILGTTAVIVPIAIPPEIMEFDIWVMLATTVLLMLLAIFRITLGKPAGFAMVGGYFAYIFVVFAIARTL
ncbi:calcium/sodium antiporter [Breoghania sp. L-A4]|uniref:calcium/sodium antiporter n=1 Tax=Breoghania sp. L-A4 TaxID=2304600 RepID=UPI000E35CA63|nr:calcium/sodium antiporter [Breoghania sp. L-A4]AXS41430.1 sodium:calcium antiporter [Breoghania sp. L-A4]